MTDINRINELMGEKKFEEALQDIRNNLIENPDNLELLKLGGLAAVNLNYWNDAKNYFETAVKFEPKDATSWFYLAKCYENSSDLISAKNSYKKVIEYRNEYLDAYTAICVVLIKLNDFNEAMEYAKKANSINSENYIYDFILGTCNMKIKEFEIASEYLLSAKEKCSDDIPTLNALGTCYIALSQTDKAKAIYESVIEISPQSSVAYYNLGSAYQITQEHEQACKYLTKALELEEDEIYLSALALSEVKLEKYDLALHHYKQLALMSPGKENYKYNVVTCYEALGDYKTAIKLLEEMIYLNSKFILPAQKLANLYIKTNQLVKAKEIYDKILLKNNIDTENMHQYAILSSSLCDTDTAEKMLKKVIKMNPDIAKAHKDLAIVYLNKRLFDYAEDEFKTALKLAPSDSDILFEYGNFLYSISKNQEAEEYYSLALEISPNDVLILTFMGLNKLVLNKLEEAKECVMKAIKIEPAHEYVQYCTGRILYANGEYEDALRYLIKSVEQNPDIETQNVLALTYFRLENYEQALNIFKNIIQKNPQSISVLMDIARCYEALKDNDSALEYLNKVTDIFPDNEEAHEMIRKLS